MSVHFLKKIAAFPTTILRSSSALSSVFRSPLSTTATVSSGKNLNTTSLTGTDNSIFGYIPPYRLTRSKKKPLKKKDSFPPGSFLDKPFQLWHEWDGFGRYKYRHHSYPNNFTLRDVQRRRILKLFAKDRMRLNTIRKADIIPKDIRKLAHEEIQKVPRDSAITRVNRRCTLTGKSRGIFHQFRVSRMVFRMEADYNKVSGVQRAYWLHGINIKP